MATGEPQWTVDGRDWLFTPVVVGGVAYVGARRSVHAYDVTTGALLARTALPGRSAEPADITQRIVVVDGGLYFGDSLGGFHAASVNSSGAGLQLKRGWKASFGIHELRFAAKAVPLKESVACLYADGQMHGLDTATGTKLWRISLGTRADAGGLTTDGESVYDAHGRELRRITLE